MEQVPSNCVIELSCIAQQKCVDVWTGMIPTTASWDDLPGMAEQCLNAWWEERNGKLSPIVQPSETNPIPDEIVIRIPGGQIVCRYNIVQAMNTLWMRQNRVD